MSTKLAGLSAREGPAFGVDSIQSILIALQKVGAEIYTSEAHKSGKLSWLERGDGYGFPLPRNSISL